MWIVEYFLTRHAIPIPAGGVVVKCYSRFDAVLGAVESVSLTDGFAAGNVAPCDIGVYNLTGQAYCGFHYEPLYEAGGVPPPPVPPPSPFSPSPRMRAVPPVALLALAWPCHAPRARRTAGRIAAG